MNKSKMERIGLGMYLSETNDLHVDIPEMLRHFGWPETEEKKDECIKIVQEVFAKLHPDVSQKVVKHFDL